MIFVFELSTLYKLTFTFTDIFKHFAAVSVIILTFFGNKMKFYDKITVTSLFGIYKDRFARFFSSCDRSLLKVCKELA